MVSGRWDERVVRTEGLPGHVPRLQFNDDDYNTSQHVRCHVECISAGFSKVEVVCCKHDSC